MPTWVRFGDLVVNAEQVVAVTRDTRKNEVTIDSVGLAHAPATADARMGQFGGRSDLGRYVLQGASADAAWEYFGASRADLAEKLVPLL